MAEWRAGTAGSGNEINQGTAMRKGSWQGPDRLARLISTESASKKVVAECGEEGQGPNRDSER